MDRCEVEVRVRTPEKRIYNSLPNVIFHSNNNEGDSVVI